MADPSPKPTLWQQLTGIGRSLVDLGRALEGKAASIPADSNPELDLPLMLPAPPRHAENAQLLTQRTPGWHVPHPSHLPVPTYAPAMTAFGIVFIALGAVTVWPVSLIGAVIFFAAIAKWIGELLYD